MPFEPGIPTDSSLETCGPGRPPRSQEDRILDAIIRNLPDDQLEEFARIVVDKAVHGSVKGSPAYAGVPGGHPSAAPEDGR